MNIHELDDFTTAYLECALWSSIDTSSDNGNDTLEENYDISDFSPECLEEAVADCKAFQAAHEHDFHTLLSHREGDPTSNCYKHAGHDFWLTRNGHGSGFWDGDYPQDVGIRLTLAAKEFGEVDLYVCDDGMIHSL